jgi:hypothetical protein
MSLIYFDGFDQYDTYSDLTTFGGWYAVSSIFDISTFVRYGTGKSLLGTGVPAARYLLPSEQAGLTVTVGFAYLKGNPTNNFTLLTICDTALSVQVYLTINPFGYLEAKRGSTVLVTGNTPILPNTWYYIEVQFLVADAGGTFDCRVNNVNEFSFVGDTQSSASDSVASVTWAGSGTVGGYYIDDLYILNSVGAINNTYLGEQRCMFLPPIGDNSVAWTRNTGASNFSAIGGVLGNPDDATTFVSASAPGVKDVYDLTDIASDAIAVAGVKLITRSQKTDVNPKSFKHGIKSGGTDQQVTYSLGTGYANYIDVFETSDGATPFTPTTINSLTSTIEVVS